MKKSDALGRALRWLREERQLRQLDVADAAGITRSMLSSYEGGKVKPTLETLERILRALDYDLSDLSRVLHMVHPQQQPALSSLEDLAENGVLQETTPSATAEHRAFLNLQVALQRWLEALRRASLERTAGPQG